MRAFIRGLSARRKTALVALAPVLACAVGVALVMPARSGGRVGPDRPETTSTTLAPATPAGARTAQALPHDESATIGAPRFTARPPRRAGRRLSSSGALPTVALEAYEHAAAVMAGRDPGCHLSWADLAAIGEVESSNGLTFGSAARVSPNGTLTPPILGPVLDGKNGWPAYLTPDHGRLEHGGRYERAVGPMQFLPSTWLEYAQDGNGDGQANPQNFWDAALTAGVFLCANGGDLARRSGFDGAVLAYNRSTSYLALVRAWALFYARSGPAGVARPGARLLQVGTAGPRPHRGRSGSSSGTKRASVRLEALVAGAVRSTEAKGGYTCSFDVVSANRRREVLAQGSAQVTAGGRAAELSVEVPGTGTFRAFEASFGRHVEVSLPPSMSQGLGEPARAWLAYDAALRRVLPGAVVADLDFALAEAPGALEEMAGATPGIAVTGHSVIGGVATTAYGGTVDLVSAAADDPALGAHLRRLEASLGTAEVGATAWIDGRGFIRELLYNLPRIRGAVSSRALAELRLGDFGSRVSLPEPATARFPPASPPTTTTTSSTTTTTTTSTTTTTTTTVPETTMTGSFDTSSGTSSGSSAGRNRPRGGAPAAEAQPARTRRVGGALVGSSPAFARRRAKRAASRGAHASASLLK